MAGSGGVAQAPRLLSIGPAVTPAEYTLRAEGCSLGRNASCDIVVGGTLISRLHATITPHGLRYLLSDASSLNGTYVNGARIQSPHLLANDDAIGLGSPEPRLRFVDPDPTAPAAVSPPPQPARLLYDSQSIQFTLDARPLDLTLMQTRLLTHLYRNAGAVCSRESCAEAIWGREYQPGVDAGALDQAMTGLRQALERASPGLELIQTRRGLGYLLSLT